MEVRCALPAERRQYAAVFAVSAVIVALAATIYLVQRGAFHRFFAGVDPLAVVLVVLVLGALALHLLHSRQGIMICRKGNPEGLLVALGLPVPLALFMILADVRGAFPADINVAFPLSLGFYPVMGYVATTLFQVAPLCIVVVTAGAAGKPLGRRGLWVCIAGVSLIEPVYQVLFMADSPAWVLAAVGAQVYAVNFLQLSLLRRFDFVSAFLFRISYYLLWHVAWGYLRLGLLF
jgi:hypothetical protein